MKKRFKPIVSLVLVVLVALTSVLFSVTAVASTAAVTYEAEELEEVVFSDNWSERKSYFLSGGYGMTTVSGGTIDFAFDGSIIELVSYKSRTQGKMFISIDGAAEEIVSLYSDSMDNDFKTVIFSKSLESGEHTASIRVFGKACLDAVKINGSFGSIEEADVTYESFEADELEPTLTGEWNTKNTFLLSTRKALFTNTGGSTMQFKYTGKGFKIGSYTSKSQGKMTVSVDGGEPVEVNLYDDSIDVNFDQIVYTSSDLEYVEHTVDISATGKVYVDNIFINKEFNYKHVIILGADGAGAWFEEANTPETDAIFANGATTYTGICANPSISAQSWGSLMTGVIPSLHGLTNEITANTPYAMSDEYPTIFRIVREAMPSAVLHSYTAWNNINIGIVENGINVVKGTGDEDGVTQSAINAIKNASPELMFVQFNAPDSAGHSYGYGTQAHLDAIEQTDARIGRIYDAVVEAGILDDTLFIVTTDHGGTGKGHGGWTDDEKYIFFGATGKTINKTNELSLYIRDIPATVCNALGIEGRDNWDSYIPQNFFTDNLTPPARPASNVDSFATPTQGSAGYINNFVSSDKIVAMYNFDGDLTAANNADTGTAVGSVTYNSGIYGNGAVVSNGNYITIPNISVGSNSFAVSMWHKLDGTFSTTNEGILFGNKDWASGKNPGYLVSLRKLGYALNAADGTNRADYKNKNIPYGGWSHSLFVIDRENRKMKMYFNFEEIISVDLVEALDGKSFDTGLPFTVGADGNGNWSFPTGITVTVDDLMILNVAPDATDITNLKNYYNNYYFGATTDKELTSYVNNNKLTAAYTFDGNANALKGTNATEIGTVEYIAGYYGQSASVNSNSLLQLDDVTFGTDSFAIATWIKPNKITSDTVIYANSDWTKGLNSGIVLSLRSNHFKANVGYNGTIRGDIVFYPDDVPTGWVHTILEFDREKNLMNFYYNFSKVYSIELDEGFKGISFDTDLPFVVGADGKKACPTNAYIDDLLIFNGTLTSAEINNLKDYYTK